MSEFHQADDEERPDDQDWEAAVDGALQQAAAVDEATLEPPRRRSKGKILALLLIPLVVATSWGVWTLTRPVQPLEPQAQEASLAGVLYILSQQLEAHLAEQGVYPSSLDAVSPPLGGVTYVLEGGGYVLEATANGVELSYASWEDSGVLLALAGSPVLQEMSR